MARRLTQTFHVTVDALWRALRLALPRVTNQASFWESDHRIQWSSDSTNFSWGLVFTAAVEPGPGDASVLSVTGKTKAWVSFSDRGQRNAVFDKLVDGVTDVVGRPELMAYEVPTEDRVRYWNGAEWSIEPPPSPSEKS